MALGSSARQIVAASGIELHNISHGETRNTTLVDDPTATAPSSHEALEPLPAAESDPARSTNFVELQQWWSSVICPTVNHNPSVDRSHNHDARDYLALERTFLARVRTANALALFGVALVQLLRLNNLDPKAGLAIGAVTASGGAIIVLAGLAYVIAISSMVSAVRCLIADKICRSEGCEMKSDDITGKSAAG
ncbi:MAG: hypothetical protein Q9179_001110 [Wetmoreana sp. 5 TL-2023]